MERRYDANRARLASTEKQVGRRNRLLTAVGRIMELTWQGDRPQGAWHRTTSVVPERC